MLTPGKREICNHAISFKKPCSEPSSVEESHPIQRHKTTAAGGNNNAVAAQDLKILQQELQTLQGMMRDQRSQTNHVESLTRSVSAQSIQLEQRLESIESHVNKIAAVEQIVSGTRNAPQHNPAIQVLLENLKPVAPFIKRCEHTILGAIISTIVVIFCKSASEEVADLARRTLQQESLIQSIQEALQMVANNPSALETLNELVQQLIQNESTVQDLVDLIVQQANAPEVQKTLTDVLQLVFKDPCLQELAGEFLLKGLDVPEVKKMLDAQTVDLVRDTASDDSVQKATAAAAKSAFWCMITPPFLWRFFPTAKKMEDMKSEENISDKQLTQDEADDPTISKPEMPMKPVPSP